MSAIDPNLLAALREGLFFSLCVGLACSALWGLWLLLAPAGAQRFAQSADRWVGTEAWFEQLNQPYSTTRWFYRYHRAAGILIASGAAYGIWQWWSAYDREAVIGLLDPRIRAMGLDWLVPALESMFLVFNGLIVVFGVVVIFRPSLLKTPERWANRWVKVEADQALDRRFDPLAEAVDKRPRLLGALVAGSCSYLLWALLPHF
jgi:hypothetical protein